MTPRPTTLFMALTLAVACSSEDPPTPLVERDDPQPYVSGTRLRAEVVGTPGAAGFMNWWDSELSSRCVFAKDEAGTLRCLPGVWSVVEGVPYRRNVVAVAPRRLKYVDADCSVPVHVRHAAEVAPTFAAGAISLEPCEDEPRHVMFRVGAPLAASAPLFTVDGLDRCVPTSLDASSIAHRLVERVSPRMFVAATHEREPWPSGLVADVLVADDGAREVVGAYDVDRDERCWVGQYFGEEAGACLPLFHRMAFIGIEFADANCTEPLGYDRNAASCAPPQMIGDLIDVGVVMYETGESVPNTTIFAGGGRPCRVDSDPDKRFYRPGAVIPYGTFPTFTEVFVEGSDGFTWQFIADVDGTPLRAYEPRNGTDSCTLVDTCDGTTRCIGETIFPPRRFSDAQCTSPIAAVYDTENILIATDRDDATCAPTAQYGPLVMLGPAYAGPSYILDDGVCVMASPPTDGLMLFELGPVANLDGAPRVDRRVE